jgi:hypothetical protein
MRSNKSRIINIYLAFMAAILFLETNLSPSVRLSPSTADFSCTDNIVIDGVTGSFGLLRTWMVGNLIGCHIRSFFQNHIFSKFVVEVG